MWDNIKLGEKRFIKKTFNEEEVFYYAKYSNDANPIHYDVEYASKTFFGKPIVQGLFVSSLFGGLLGSELPGNGTIHLGQELRFMKPVYVGETIKASIEIIDIQYEKKIIVFNCEVVKSDNTKAIVGKATVMYKGRYFF
jgi:acyl dehydratase